MCSWNSVESSVIVVVSKVCATGIRSSGEEGEERKGGGGQVYIPEVEILRHVHLLECVDVALLFCGFLNLLIEAYRYHIRVFAMVKIVSSQQCDDRSFRNNDHIPACGKLDEPCRQ